MSLRDYFAAAALMGLLGAETEEYYYSNSPTKSRHELAAAEAYKMADAMLQAREQ